ncbi:MAG: ubiquitin-conjugating enzyme E2, partial [Saprospiraceae bacterium]
MYDFKDPEFGKFPLYKRLAKEHLSIQELKGNVIEWKVLEKKGKFNVPFSYLIKYKIKSIVALNQDKSPVYGDEHLIKITFPPTYPTKPPFLYAQTDIWHPNIKYDDINDKGRICSNSREFGKTFSLYDYVIWIGKIIQYQIYHAEFTPPFPEFTPAAEWILNYVEPNGLIDKANSIHIDNTNLISKTINESPKPEIVPPAQVKRRSSIKIKSRSGASP